MDRRSFLRFAGVGAMMATVMPKLVLPAIQKLAVPDPQRRFFLPPAHGWLDLPSAEDVANWRVAQLNPDDYLRRYTSPETTYDVETFDELLPAVFALNGLDTVRVEFGRGVGLDPGVVVIDRIEMDSFTGRTRLRGYGVESFYGQKLSPPIAIIKAHCGTVTRSLGDRVPGHIGSLTALLGERTPARGDARSER